MAVCQPSSLWANTICLGGHGVAACLPLARWLQHSLTRRGVNEGLEEGRGGDVTKAMVCRAGRPKAAFYTLPYPVSHSLSDVVDSINYNVIQAIFLSYRLLVYGGGMVSVCTMAWQPVFLAHLRHIR